MKTYAHHGLLIAALLTGSVQAANYTVTTAFDSGPGSLRAILTVANGVAGPHSICFTNTGYFSAGGTINLTSELPAIVQSTTITGWRNAGSSANAITISGSRLVFAGGTTNSLQQLNINNSVDNYSVDNSGTLTVGGCAIGGGGIVSRSALQLLSSSVSSSPGAGIWNSGNATLNDVSVSSCADHGIYSQGTMAVANSLIVGNRTSAQGAGIYSSGSLQLTGCQIVGNTATNAATDGIGGGL